MNRTRWVIQCVLFSVLNVFCVNAMPQQNTENSSSKQMEVRQNALQRAQKLLEDAAKHPAVTWIKVKCVPFDRLYYIALKPEDLDRGGSVYNIQKDRTDLQSLIPALQRTKLKGIPEKASPAVRLAITLYDAESVRLVSVYMTPHGTAGYINSIMVEFEETSDDVYDWVYENFTSCFKNSLDIDFYKDRQNRILQKQSGMP